MMTKLLLTILVILAALTFLRHQKRPQHSAVVAVAPGSGRPRLPLIAALAFAALTLAVSGFLFYQHWAERHTLFEVVIINSHSGERRSYRAYHQDIGRRSFRTIDARQINLADTERMEVQEAASP